MKSFKTKILKNEQVAPHAYKITLAASEIAKKAQPGQFVMVKVNDALDPLLRRPFGIHRINKNLEILYEIKGEGTRALAQKKPGEILDIIGSLGNGFDVRTPNPEPRTPVLIAGGMGVAPMVFLAQKLASLKPVVLIGAKTKSHVLCEKEFKKLGCDVKVATDDGSYGLKGLATDLLNIDFLSPRRGERIKVRGESFKHLALPPHPNPLPRHRRGRGDIIFYACGPNPMLAAVAAIVKQRNIPAQVSLEEHMACGIGACLGCVIDTVQGRKRVCKEGPVFNSNVIIWDRRDI